MKLFGVSVLALLIVVAILGVLVILGPLRSLLPSGVQTRINSVVPNYFSTPMRVH